MVRRVDQQTFALPIDRPTNGHSHFKKCLGAPVKLIFRFDPSCSFIRFPVTDFFLEDLPNAYPEAFDNDDCMALFRNACIFNKKPSAYYLEMDDWVKIHDLFGMIGKGGGL